jgi:hypothetical protein
VDPVVDGALLPLLALLLGDEGTGVLKGLTALLLLRVLRFEFTSTVVSSSRPPLALIVGVLGRV